MPNLVENVIPVFTDIDGDPLENGYIFIGEPNVNPISNPLQAYWDADLTIPATDIRTKGGYPSNDGTPGRLYTATNYSIIVQDKKGTTVYTQLNSIDYYNAASGEILKRLDTIIDLRGETPTATDTDIVIKISGYYEKGDISDIPMYYWDATSTESDNGGSVIKPDNIDSAEGGRWIWASDITKVNVKWFGAVGDSSTSGGGTDNTDIFNNAISYSRNIYIPEGLYLITETLTISTGFNLIGDNFDYTGIVADLITGDNLFEMDTTDSNVWNGKVHCEFKGLYILNVNGNSNDNICFNFPTLGMANLSKFEKLNIVKFTTAIYIPDTYMITMKQVRVQACEYGFEIGGTSISLENCWAIESKVGFIIGGVYSTLTNCILERPQDGGWSTDVVGFDFRNDERIFANVMLNSCSVEMNLGTIIKTDENERNLYINNMSSDSGRPEYFFDIGGSKTNVTIQKIPNTFQRPYTFNATTFGEITVLDSDSFTNTADDSSLISRSDLFGIEVGKTIGLANINNPFSYEYHTPFGIKRVRSMYIRQPGDTLHIKRELNVFSAEREEVIPITIKCYPVEWLQGSVSTIQSHYLHNEILITMEVRSGQVQIEGRIRDVSDTAEDNVLDLTVEDFGDTGETYCEAWISAPAGMVYELSYFQAQNSEGAGKSLEIDSDPYV